MSMSMLLAPLEVNGERLFFYDGDDPIPGSMYNIIPIPSGSEAVGNEVEDSMLPLHSWLKKRSARARSEY